MKYIKYLFILFLITNTISSPAKKRKHQIVFQFTNADTMQQKAFVRQLENISELWPNAQYEVVLYNQGVDLLMKNNTNYIEKLKVLKHKGIRFVICENTLKNRKLNKDVFVEELTEYVPAGIAEIIEKQEEGWSYIKGGF